MPPPLSQLPGSLQVSGILPVLFRAGDQRARVQLSVTCARPQPRANGQRPDPHPASRPPFLQRQGPGPGAHAESSFPWGETAWPERDTCLLLESRGSSGQLLGKPLTVKKMTNEPLTQCLEAPDPAKEDGRPQSLRGGGLGRPPGARQAVCVCVCVVSRWVCFCLEPGLRLLEEASTCPAHTGRDRFNQRNVPSLSAGPDCGPGQGSGDCARVSRSLGSGHKSVARGLPHSHTAGKRGIRLSLLCSPGHVGATRPGGAGAWGGAGPAGPGARAGLGSPEAAPGGRGALLGPRLAG